MAVFSKSVISITHCPKSLILLLKPRYHWLVLVARELARLTVIGNSNAKGKPFLQMTVEEQDRDFTHSCKTVNEPEFKNRRYPIDSVMSSQQAGLIWLEPADPGKAMKPKVSAAPRNSISTRTTCDSAFSWRVN